MKSLTNGLLYDFSFSFQLGLDDQDLTWHNELQLTKLVFSKSGKNQWFLVL